jgi:hypothetical protein
MPAMADAREDDTDIDKDKEDDGGQIHLPTPLLCLDNAVVVFVTVTVNNNDNYNTNRVPPSMLPEAAAIIVDVVIIFLYIPDRRRPQRGGRTMQLPGCNEGSYYPHPAASTRCRLQTSDNGC